MPLPSSPSSSELVHHQAARLEQPPDLVEVARQVTLADVLEHPHARDLVVGCVFRHVAVVHEPHLAAVPEAERLDALVHVGVLSFGERDAGRLDAVVARRPENQAAPAAADIQETFPGLEQQFPADMVELLLLRKVQRVVGLAEIGAGIDPIAVQPERIEIVADVVVVLDRFAIRRAGMAPPIPHVGALAVDGRVSLHQSLAQVHRLAGVPVDVDVALDVGLCDLAQAGIGKRQDGLRRPYGEPDFRAVGGTDDLAIP